MHVMLFKKQIAGFFTHMKLFFMLAKLVVVVRLQKNLMLATWRWSGQKGYAQEHVRSNCKYFGDVMNHDKH